MVIRNVETFEKVLLIIINIFSITFLSLSLSLSLSLFLLIDRMLTSLRSLLVALVKTYSVTLLKHMLYLDTPYHLLSGKSSVVMHEGLPEVYALTNG